MSIILTHIIGIVIEPGIVFQEAGGFVCAVAKARGRG
jgi:hypothetical protein